MAIDGWMLKQLQLGGPSMLRLYRWSAPALSLGRHQQRWPEHWHEAGVELVPDPELRLPGVVFEIRDVGPGGD